MQILNVTGSGSGAGGPPSLVPPETRAEELARVTVTDANRQQVENDWKEVLACLSKAKLARLKSIQPEFRSLLIERWFRLMGTPSTIRSEEATETQDISRVLWMEECPFSECSFAAFLEALEENTHGVDSNVCRDWAAEDRESVGIVHCLRMARGTLTGEQMVRVARILQKHSGIKELFLEGNHVGDDAVQQVAEVLREGHQLSILNLSANGVRDEAAQAVADVLTHYPKGCLQKLYLMENQIGNDGAKALGKALEVNSTLTELHVEHNSIEEEGIASLSEAAKSNTLCSVCFDGSESSSSDGEDPSGNDGVVKTGELDRPEVTPGSHPGGDIEESRFRRFAIEFPTPKRDPKED